MSKQSIVPLEENSKKKSSDQDHNVFDEAISLEIGQNRFGELTLIMKTWCLWRGDGRCAFAIRIATP
jgi:hypothetical protein